tara:strand:+ start:13 stop:618 length:606 start_codon:yes stop_codon:yes gene_type:complete
MWKDESQQTHAHYLFQCMLWVSLACAVLLFMPSKLASLMQVDKFLTDYAHFVGISFIISSAYLVLDLGKYIVNNLQQRKRQQQLGEEIQSRMQTLSSGERAILREFYLRRQTSLWLPHKEADVKSLRSSGILIPVDFYNTTKNNEQGIREIELMISHIARPFLTKARLKLPQGKPSFDDISYLKQARPSYLEPLTNLKKSA